MQGVAGSAAALAGAVAIGLAVWPRVEDATHITEGRTLYAKHCVSCHGLKLEGEPDWQAPKPDGRMPAPPHDASGHTWHHSDQELHRITKLGMSAVVPNYESAMPGFQSALSDEEIDAILAFIKSTWPTRERDYKREVSSRR